MELAVPPPLLPMLAKRVSALPQGGDWIFEPKWDGFRTLFFRDGDEILLQSRDQKSLNRYFPELLEPLKAGLPEKCVCDGEIVVARDGALDFDALQLRVHPAASRVKLLSTELPASVVFFDLLCENERDLRTEPFAARRKRLEDLLRTAQPPLFLTPSTTDRETANAWFGRFEGAGLDGVMAKAPSGVYEANKRVMLKVKHDRECDCVVAGFRWHKKSGDHDVVGSLLLGLYDDAGNLQHVGVCASFTMQKRRELVQVLAPYRENALDQHPWRSWADSSTAADGAQRMPGGKSRWSGGKDLSWEPLRAELVVEVAYDHLQSGRFRHTAQFRRFRSDKSPQDCTYAQLEVVAPQELAEIFGT
ncbi:MAG TPA: ATP-dependent DNA ligase [Polyangiaceae bacterium]|nr:ATP-dependent DNA ligase [Polyangiaceae bacterium]